MYDNFWPVTSGVFCVFLLHNLHGARNGPWFTPLMSETACLTTCDSSINSQHYLVRVLQDLTTFDWITTSLTRIKSFLERIIVQRYRNVRLKKSYCFLLPCACYLKALHINICIGFWVENWKKTTTKIRNIRKIQNKKEIDPILKNKMRNDFFFLGHLFMY